MDDRELWRVTEQYRRDLIAFAQRLIRVPSLPGHEDEVAILVQAEMERLGYDRVWIDGAGNAIGQLAGADGSPLIFNGHMDHVDPGDPALWRHPPHGGEIHDGELWGRGSVDMKGAVAAMIYAGGLLGSLGATLPGDLYATAVVQEEVGGLGARHLARTLPMGHVVVGEASGNHLRRGHRGRVEFGVHLQGRSVHASMPDLGINPHYSLSRFLEGLKALPMASHPEYGSSTVAPTCVESEPQSANVTPSAIRLTLDWRNVPGEDMSRIATKLDTLLARCLEPGCSGEIELCNKALVSYTGLRMEYPDSFASFATPADHPWLAEVQPALSSALDREVEVGTWRFATDGGHFAEAGATVIGFGPGDDAIVHTVEERLPLDQLVESVVGYMVLALQPRLG
jgi:succinyl-diaminopimelate desuccinylase